MHVYMNISGMHMYMNITGSLQHHKATEYGTMSHMTLTFNVKHARGNAIVTGTHVYIMLLCVVEHIVDIGHNLF